MNLNDALIKAYGTQIVDDIEIIKAKFAIVVSAHLHAGHVDDNPLCVLNRLLQDIMAK